jgi:anaerobic dimethyl sulfoxide reductase subunit A
MSSPVKRSRRCRFDEFRRIFKQRDPEGHHVAYKAFRESAANPLTTPSGKLKSTLRSWRKIAATWSCRKGCYRSAADIQPWV